MRKSSKQIWFIGFVVVNLLMPERSEAFFGGNDGGSGLEEILAAGLIVQLLMGNMGSGGGGGGGGGRSSLLGSIGERIAGVASRHRHQMMSAPPPGEELPYARYPFHQHPAHPLLVEQDFESHHLPAEMQLIPLFSRPGAPILFGESNFPQMIGMPFEDFVPRESMLGAPSIDYLDASHPFESSETTPTLIIDENHNLRSLPPMPPRPDMMMPPRPDVMMPSSADMRPQYILPRIVRHFVQRFMRRTGHN